MDALDDDLAHLNVLDVTWGFDLDAFLQERARQAPAPGEAGDGTAETMDSSQGRAVDASSALIGTATTPETMGSSRGVAVDAPSAPMRRAEIAETMGSCLGGAVDASSVPAGRAESDPGAASASDTGQGNGEDPPAVLSGRPAHDPSSWGRLPDSAGPDPGSEPTPVG